MKKLPFVCFVSFVVLSGERSGLASGEIGQRFDPALPAASAVGSQFSSPSAFPAPLRETFPKWPRIVAEFSPPIATMGLFAGLGEKWRA